MIETGDVDIRYRTMSATETSRHLLAAGRCREDRGGFKGRRANDDLALSDPSLIGILAVLATYSALAFVSRRVPSCGSDDGNSRSAGEARRQTDAMLLFTIATAR